MQKILRALALTLVLCVPLSADIIISTEIYEVGTNTPLAQPIMVGDMFDVVYTATDDVGLGLSVGSVEWNFDAALVTQSGITTWGLAGPLSGYAYLVPPTTATATGGVIEFQNSASASNPFEIVRIKYTADAVGSAVFDTAGFIQGDPPDPTIATFSTEDSRAFFPDGSPANAAAMGEMIVFGNGKVNIVPEPSSIAILLVGALALIRRR